MKNKLRNPAAFIDLFCAILNALFADNRYFFVFAVSCTVFSALLLYFCLKSDEKYEYKAVFSVFYAVAVPSALCGLFGNVSGYRCGALLFIIIGASETVRMIKRVNKKALAAAFAAVPLAAALCFIACDIKPELKGNETHGAVTKRTYDTSRGASVIYLPENARGGETPAIAYLHGFYAYNNSDIYEDTYYYLASQGYIVIAPNYESIFLNPAYYSKTAAEQITDGMKYAERAGFKVGGVGLIGHSVGAVTALNICAEELLPVKFVMALDASDGGADIIPKKSLSGVSPDLNVLIAAGEDDNSDCFETSLFFRDSLKDHPESAKAFYVLQSDENGNEYVKADHNWMIKKSGEADNLLVNAAFKWAKALADWTFYGENYDMWHGDTALDMGTWSDGKALKPAVRGTGLMEKGE